MTTVANPPDVAAFFDDKTFTVSYVVSDPAGDQAVIIDPVLDYAPGSGRTSTESADRLVAHVNERRLTVGWSLETHAHADHLTAAQYIKQKLGAGVAIGAHISAVQQTFGELFNLGGAFPADGSQFDRLLAEGDRLEFGGLTLSVMHTPGHTPACSTYVIGDAAFVGDTIFQPDFGTARCDFPGGDAATLYRSIRRILSLPPETRIFTCHDYGPNGRPYAWESTVAAQRASNVHVRDGIDQAAFVKTRAARDRTLAPPALIIPALQVNIRAGALPPAEDNGVSYLKIPLNQL